MVAVDQPPASKAHHDALLAPVQSAQLPVLEEALADKQLRRLNCDSACSPRSLFRLTFPGSVFIGRGGVRLARVQAGLASDSSDSLGDV